MRPLVRIRRLGRSRRANRHGHLLLPLLGPYGACRHRRVTSDIDNALGKAPLSRLNPPVAGLPEVTLNPAPASL